MSDLISRDEILGGMSARRAATVLHAIRSRTAAAAGRSRRPMGAFVGEHSAHKRESEFLAALASDRAAREKPSIQDLERYAADWQRLVPEQAALRAEVARRLAADEPIPRDRVPRLRRALQLDEPETQRAYEEATGAAIDGLYVQDIGPRERLAWLRSKLAERLEMMPPFWVAFSITLTECVGAGILALPVAMGGVGPLGAVLLIAIFGMINIGTVAALSESITRTGSMRYGTSYFGRLVGAYFGRTGVWLMSAAVFALNATMLLVALIGFGEVLSSLIGLPAWAWAGGLFVVNLWMLGREHLDGTIASAIVTGVLNIVLILAVCAIAFTDLRGTNFDEIRVPLLDGKPVDKEILTLVFGVVMIAFFGHTSAANSAKIVLERDPSGRALLRGNAAAIAAATVLYALTVLAFGGALSPDALVNTTGTALEPLSAQSGVAVEIFGTLFAVMAIGMGSIYASLGLYNQVLEWRPQAQRVRRLLVGAALPTVLFLVVVWLVESGRESFADPLGYVGALTVPMLAGIMPMVLVVASRRRGEVAMPRTRFVGNPVAAVLVGALFLSGIVIQGMVIWTTPAAKAASLLAAAASVAAVVGSVRAGAFRPRTVVELRREPERDLGYVALTEHGRAGAPELWIDGERVAAGSIERFSRLRELTIVFPTAVPADLCVWAHRVTGDGGSEEMTVDVRSDGNRLMISP